MALRGDTSPLGIAIGLLVSGFGVGLFVYRFARRASYRKAAWSDFGNWGVFALVPVTGMVFFSIYLLGLLVHLARLALRR